MLRTVCAVYAAVLLLISPVYAGDVLVPGAPAEVGMSAEKLAEASELVSEAVAADDLRGAVLLVARRGKVVLHEAVGWRNREAEQPMQPDSLFRMASNTKPVVAAAVLMLAEDGLLHIDDPVGRYLPALREGDWSRVTIRHLLSHTSGLRINGLFLKPLLEPSSVSPGTSRLVAEVNRFAEFGPEEPPGTTYRYNNAGYNTLGALIEVRSGKPLQQYLAERIYRPLGMLETTHRPPPEKLDRMCVVYEREENEEGDGPGEWKIRFRQKTTMRVPFVRASGGMVSTAEDYARFCHMYLCGGTYNGRRILSPESITAATSPQTRHVRSQDDDDGDSHSFYGLGWSVSADGVYWHGGSEGTFAWVDPKRELVGLIFTQSPDGDIPRERFMELAGAACRDSGAPEPRRPVRCRP